MLFEICGNDVSVRVSTSTGSEARESVQAVLSRVLSCGGSDRSGRVAVCEGEASRGGRFQLQKCVVCGAEDGFWCSAGCRRGATLPESRSGSATDVDRELFVEAAHVTECRSGGGRAPDVGVAGSATGDVVVSEKTLRNREKRKKRKEQLRAAKELLAADCAVPLWRRKVRVDADDESSVGTPGLSRSVRTVDTRTAEEIEAARTLAIRRSAENRVAAAMSEHKLTSLLDPDKTKTLRDLDAVRMQERINTTRAKSQASFKKCASPLESVGSAASAGEFALKQEIRKNVALKTENKNLEEQLDKLLKVATPGQLTMLANLELRYVPTEEEIMAMDDDVSPYYSVDDMEEEAAKFRLGGGTKREVSSALPSTSELMASLREMDATG